MKAPWTRRPVNWAPADVPLNPFENGKVEWNRWLQGAWKNATRWRVVAILTLVLLAGSLVQMGRLAERVKVVPYGIEVNETGRVRGVGLLPQAKEVPESVKQQWFEAMLTRWIEDFRTLTLDGEYEKKKWWHVYAFLTNKSAEWMDVYIKTTRPMAQIGQITVQVKDLVVLPVTERTFQIEWTEGVKDVQSGSEQTTKYKGMFDVLLGEPSSRPEVYQRNPLGLYIGALGFRKVG